MDSDLIGNSQGVAFEMLEMDSLSKPSSSKSYRNDDNYFSKDQKYSSKFVGLSNQGATCYMNSLLQTLFMTPEFRDKIYKWQHDYKKHGDPKDSIPFQLQLLFSKLQLRKHSYIETTDLTKSFGWDRGESFQQHDVQEFCRVLFDAIEESVRDTEQENMINQLYEGTMIDYVRCLNCSYESSREDKFLDLSLTVRNEFDKIYNDSVEKALANYIQADMLTGENKYYCEQCTSKQDAKKGLKFKNFPYILALQLKRFDLDYNTFQRIKLNDSVSFEQILNMNQFIGENPPEPSAFDKKLSSQAAVAHEFLDTPSLKVIPDNIDSLQLHLQKFSDYNYIIEDDNKRPIKLDHVAKQKLLEFKTEERKRKQSELIANYMQEGEYVYELFSILIHSGSAHGGHYYAYIKNFEDSRWYNFNDSTVTEIDEKEIEKVFGGVYDNSSWSSSYSDSAYLLMYRKIKPSNLSKIDDELVPEYIKAEIERQEESELKEAMERAEKYNSMQIRVYYNNDDELITIKKDEKLEALKHKAKAQFKLDNVRDQDVRLRGYSLHNNMMQEPYDEDKTIDDLGIWSYKTFALEMKSPDEEWSVYDPNLIVVNIVPWTQAIENSETSIQESVENADKIQIDKRSNVKQLMELLSDKYSIPFDKMKIIKKPYMGHSSYAEVVSSAFLWDQPLSQARVFESSTLLIEETENPALKSKWQEELEREANRFCIRFNHPKDLPNSYGQIEYKHSVVIDCTKTMKELKAAISNKLKIPVEEFLIRRGTRSGIEIKDLSQKLIHCNLMNNSVIHVERGKPSGANEYRIQVSLAEIAGPEDDDGTIYRFYDLIDTALNGDALVADIKEEISDAINLKYPSMMLNPLKIRLRERTGDRLSRVMRNTEELKIYSLFEQKKLTIQILTDKEEEISANDLMIVVRKWSPSTWEISPPREIMIKKYMKMHDLGERLSEEFGIPVVYI